MIRSASLLTRDLYIATACGLMTRTSPPSTLTRRTSPRSTKRVRSANAVLWDLPLTPPLSCSARHVPRAAQDEALLWRRVTPQRARLPRLARRQGRHRWILHQGSRQPAHHRYTTETKRKLSIANICAGPATKDGKDNGVYICGCASMCIGSVRCSDL